ncbi:hypothetical protein SDC9_151597 [bioreactor metagenome]|uniref:Uncharacterized protein n=1 Tax=bioreactor metagenome TaxID=1076179 RepID=A0A645ESI0_9ZZZZ
MRRIRVGRCESRYRSWETTRTVPSNFINAVSSASLAGMSRWLVGSSITRTLPCSSMTIASLTRARSPPERTPIVLKASSPSKCSPPNSVRSVCSLESGKRSHSSISAVLSGCRSEESCSKQDRLTLRPHSMSPFAGGSFPISVFNNVDFPAPFSPIMATRSPRLMCMSVSRSRHLCCTPSPTATVNPRAISTSDTGRLLGSKRISGGFLGT